MKMKTNQKNMLLGAVIGVIAGVAFSAKIRAALGLPA